MTGTFRYEGRVYPYLDAKYNGTRINERAVEVPVALDLLNDAVRTLEVGAVLPHYLPDWPEHGHEVVDLHEECPGVTNADVLEYAPSRSYDLVLCISTLDHLRDADEVERAVKQMRSWLSAGGRLFATIPAGQPAGVGGGPWLDDLVLSGGLGAEVKRMDKVDPARHLWAECPPSEPPLPYHGPSHFANTVYFLEWWEHE